MSMRIRMNELDTDLELNPLNLDFSCHYFLSNKGGTMFQLERIKHHISAKRYRKYSRRLNKSQN